MRTTWALQGKTPVILSAGSWKRLSLATTIFVNPRGTHPRLFLRSVAGSIDSAYVLLYLNDLKRHRRKKLLLVWDGLPAHRARIVIDWIRKNRSWLRVERLPAYAPELNPPEYLWSAMKKGRLGNLGGNFQALGRAVRKCRRSMNDRALLRGFLRASGLY